MSEEKQTGESNDNSTQSEDKKIVVTSYNPFHQLMRNSKNLEKTQTPPRDISHTFRSTKK